MSGSMHIVGFKPPDEKWQKMKGVFDACTAARLPVPKEVENFFEGEMPDEAGVEINLERHTRAVKKFSADMQDGFEINLDSLDHNIRKIRVFMSY